MIYRSENRETPRLGTMCFVPITSPALWRSHRDVSPVRYHTPLAERVDLMLRRLGINKVGSPNTAALIALYVVGLILLDGRQTQTRVARFLPARCHDALNRLLRLMPLSTRKLMQMLVEWVKGHGGEGYLVLDDVIVEKAFARKLPWAGWTYSFAKGRKLYGLHVVVLLWASFDAQWRIPVAFRIWRPKRSCAARRYRTKLQLAEGMLKREVLPSGVPFRYIVFDTHYTAGWFTKMLTRMGIEWVGTLHPRTVVFRGGKRLQVRQLAQRLSLKWRAQLELRATEVKVYAPKYGDDLRLVVTRKPSWQLRVCRHQFCGGGPHIGDRAKTKQMVCRNVVSRYQAVCGSGGVPVLGGSSDGSACWACSSQLRCVADDAPEAGGECREGQGEVAVGGYSTWSTATPAAEGFSGSSTGHRVSPVFEKHRKTGLTPRGPVLYFSS
jgi:hypothetical protein